MVIGCLMRVLGIEHGSWEKQEVFLLTKSFSSPPKRINSQGEPGVRAYTHLLREREAGTSVLQGLSALVTTRTS